MGERRRDEVPKVVRRAAGRGSCGRRRGRARGAHGPPGFAAGAGRHGSGRRYRCDLDRRGCAVARMADLWIARHGRSRRGGGASTPSPHSGGQRVRHAAEPDVHRAGCCTASDLARRSSFDLVPQSIERRQVGGLQVDRLGGSESLSGALGRPLLGSCGQPKYFLSFLHDFLFDSGIFSKIRQKLGPNSELLIDHFNLKGMVNSSERKKI